jgi:hypothetical protein
VQNEPFQIAQLAQRLRDSQNGGFRYRSTHPTIQHLTHATLARYDSTFNPCYARYRSTHPTIQHLTHATLARKIDEWER